MEKIKLSLTLPVDAKTLYNAWLSSEQHSAFTGSEAIINKRKGGAYSTWDGYITGVTIDMIPYTRIIQTWRTTEFDESWPDSLVDLSFVEKDGKTTLTIKQEGLAKGDGAKYKQGWKDFYFTPMKAWVKLEKK